MEPFAAAEPFGLVETFGHQLGAVVADAVQGAGEVVGDVQGTVRRGQTGRARRAIDQHALLLGILG